MRGGGLCCCAEGPGAPVRRRGPAPATARRVRLIRGAARLIGGVPLVRVRLVRVRPVRGAPLVRRVRPVR